MTPVIVEQRCEKQEREIVRADEESKKTLELEDILEDIERRVCPCLSSGNCDS